MLSILITALAGLFSPALDPASEPAPVAAAPAGHPEREAFAYIEAAADAITAAEAFRYRIDYAGRSPALPTYTARVVQQRTPDPLNAGVGLFLIDGKLTTIDGPLPFTFAYDGTWFTCNKPGSDETLRLPQPQLKDVIRLMHPIMPTGVFTSDDPLGSIKPRAEGLRSFAESGHVLESVELDGQRCTPVTFNMLYAQGTPRAFQSEVTWTFGPDALPRRVEGGTFTATYTDLEAIEAPDRSLFLVEGDARDVAQHDIPGQEHLLKAGTAAPKWKLKTAAGSVLDLAALRGRVVLLDFAATWCGPCKAAMPRMQQLHDELKNKGLSVVCINTMETRGADLEQHFKDNAFTYTLAFDRGRETANLYGVRALPTLVVIDAEGKIAGSWVGAGQDTHDAIDRRVRSLLASKN